MGLYVMKGIWWYSFQLPGQKRIRRSTGLKDNGTLSTKKAADLNYQINKINFLKGKDLNLPSGILMGNMLGEITKTFYRNPSPSQQSSIKILLEYFKEKKAAQISTKDIMEFYQWRIEKGNGGKGCRPNTVMRDLALLKHCYNIAIENGEWNITTNPVKQATKYISKDVNFNEFRRTRTPSDAELKKLYEGLSPLLQDILLFAVYTGARKGDILNLTWPNVDFKNREVIFKAKDTKEGKDRYVPMKDRIFALLQNRPRHGEYVFCTEDGKKLVPHGLIRSEFNRVRKNLGIKDLRFHDLRHLFGTRFTEGTRDIEAASKIMGHANSKITSEIYVNMQREYLQKRINEMPDFMASVVGESRNACQPSVSLDFPHEKNGEKHS